MKIAQGWMGGRLGPSELTGQAEHRRHHVIAEGADGALVLPARRGNVYLAVNERIGDGLLGHLVLSGSSDEDTRRRRIGSRKERQFSTSATTR